MNAKKTALIIGAGPAGLTAGWELQQHTDIKPVVLEMTGHLGGISRTINYKNNRMDLGGHRFFSKSDRVMEWWESFFPAQGSPSKDDIALNRRVNLSEKPGAPDPQKEDKVMLIRNRLSRIYFLRKFFSYPIALNSQTILNLGLTRISKIGMTYALARLLPIKPEKTLEDFLINRFGRELYLTFFKDYTKKVWGVPCDEINPEWGAQRIKGLSITKALAHALKQIIVKDKSISQKKTETSLIEQFLYPKFGPGQLWEEVGRQIIQRGGEIKLNSKVVGFDLEENAIKRVRAIDKENKVEVFEADYVLSTMPVKDLIAGLGDSVPPNVGEVAEGLVYRDFITVGLLLKKLRIKNETKNLTVNGIVPDNWIYIQEHDVKIGRLQIFNNWSPYMVEDENLVWIGLEYFCNEGDELWNKSDEDFIDFAIGEAEKIGIIERADVVDGTMARQPKTYPGYFGTYRRFDEIQRFTDRITNLFLIGRNGMHRYNNQDHSMLTAMTAVQNIKSGRTDKENIWSVNAEQDYHEEK